MNKRKGFFRLTLVLSLLCGALTLYFCVDENGKTFEEKKIYIPRSGGHIEALHEKLDLMRDDDFDRAIHKAFRDLRESLAKEGDVFADLEGTNYEYVFFHLSPKEKQKVKENLKKKIIRENETGVIRENETGVIWDTEKNYYCIPFGYDWTKISLSILVGFSIGFTAVWLIYAFIKLVVIGFIAGEFKDKSTIQETKVDKYIFGRLLDTTQKKIIFGGMVCFLLAGLIPPLMHSKYHFSCGYGFMFLPRNCVGSIGGLERIDFYRLSVEWILVVVLTGGLLFLSKEQKPK